MIDINNYTFKNFIIDLNYGREFDIIVYNEKYGISWFGEGRISFAKYGDKQFCKYYNSVEEFVKKSRVGEKLLSTIWDEVKIDVIY